MTFEARILGPVEASMDGRPVSLGSPKQRAVFAMLALSAGRVVSTDRLVSELWGEYPPGSPVSTLQVYISRLRRSMGGREGDDRSTSSSVADGSGGGVQLLRRAPGYQLNIPEDSVDARRFASLLATARSRLDRDPSGAQTILDQALALQRGPALADVVGLLGPNAAAEAQRLDDMRLVALEARLKALLGRGEAATAASEAAMLVQAYPLQEDLHALLMLALYRSGRQSEALAAFDVVREELADQLGVDPGATLRQLHVQILRQDPALDVVIPQPPPLDPELTPAAPNGFASSSRATHPSASIPSGNSSAATPAPTPTDSSQEGVLERHEAVPSGSPGPATGWVPEALTTLIGRGDEVRAVAAGVARGRLTAVVGAGGAGKSRLALAVCNTVQADFPDAVWWVDISVVSDAPAVPRLISAAVGSHELTDRPALTSAIARLGAARGLLVLDNCEHLAAASADIVQSLLRGCPQLHILITSREPLGLPGEQVWPVQPLALPPPARSRTYADVADSPAVQLWCERARSALPGFELTADNASVVARICARLDGLPLAIELAAARIRVLSLEEIADALDRHLDLLVGQQRGAPDRHRTLRATLDWSFRLLTSEEQQLLAQLSVFHGGFTLDAVTAVRTADPATQSTLDRSILDRSTLELVSQLIDRSLVSVADRGRPTRYRLLETVRLYAADQLVAGGQLTAVNEAHLNYFVELAELAEPQLIGPAQQMWLDRLDAEVANITAALRWSLASPHPDAGLRLVGAVWRFCYLRGLYAAGREWLEAALRTAPEAPAGLRAKALAAGGTLAYLQCDYGDAEDRLRSAQQIFESLGDTVGVATAMQSLGCVARERGDYVESRALHHDSLIRWRAAGRADAVARATNYLAFVDWLEGRSTAAAQQSRLALAYFRTSADHEGFVWSLVLQGGAALHADELTAAANFLDESRRRSEEAGYREGVAWSLNLLGVVAAHRNDHRTAQRLLRMSLQEHWDLGDLWRTSSVLEALAAAESQIGDPVAAASLLGTAAALRSRLNAPIPPVERPDVDETVARLTTVLGVADFDTARADGQLTTVEQTISELVPAVERVRDVS